LVSRNRCYADKFLVLVKNQLFMNVAAWNHGSSLSFSNVILEGMCEKSFWQVSSTLSEASSKNQCSIYLYDFCQSLCLISTKVLEFLMKNMILSQDKSDATYIFNVEKLLLILPLEFENQPECGYVFCSQRLWRRSQATAHYLLKVSKKYHQAKARRLVNRHQGQCLLEDNELHRVAKVRNSLVLLHSFGLVIPAWVNGSQIYFRALMIFLFFRHCFMMLPRQGGEQQLKSVKQKHICFQARTQGGDAGDESPPPDLKRCWHDTWFHWKSSPKYCCTAHHPLKMLKIDLC